ncbi:MAG: T9SS type A sorting domain-containing protein [Bacteroidia bacterium]
MKKIYASFLMIAVGGAMLAQQAGLPVLPSRQYMPVDPKLAAITHARMAEHGKLLTRTMRSGVVNQRLSPTGAVVMDNGGWGQVGTGLTFGEFVEPLFVDSTVTFKATAVANIRTIKAGGLLDPTSVNYTNIPTPNPTPGFIAAQPYTVDTIWVAGYYNIKNGANVGDTLQVEVNYGMKNATYYQGLQESAPYPICHWTCPKSTVSTTPGNTSFDPAPTANKVVIKRVLKLTDTISGASNPNFPYIACIPSSPLVVPAGGNVVSVQYTLVPKATHTANQDYFDFGTNASTLNSFVALLLQESNTNLGMFYDSTYKANTPYNPAGLPGAELMTKSRYGTWSASVLNGCMYPRTDVGYIWDVSVHYTPTGIEEFTKYGVSLQQNMPNPFNGTTVIGYSLEKSTDVMFTVYDMTGRIVMQNNYGVVSSGDHTITLNSSEIGKGIYFYNVKANGASLTKKMIITE